MLADGAASRFYGDGCRDKYGLRCKVRTLLFPVPGEIPQLPGAMRKCRVQSVAECLHHTVQLLQVAEIHACRECAVKSKHSDQQTATNITAKCRFHEAFVCGRLTQITGNTRRQHP